jgi:hypothetical protein
MSERPDESAAWSLRADWYIPGAVWLYQGDTERLDLSMDDVAALRVLLTSDPLPVVPPPWGPVCIDPPCIGADTTCQSTASCWAADRLDPPRPPVDGAGEVSR